MSAAPPSAELAAVVAALGARQRLRHLLIGAQIWDLLSGTYAAGWLTALGAPTTAQALAADRGLPVEQVADVLAVLVHVDVVTAGEDGTFALAPDLSAALTAPSGVGLDVVMSELELERSRTAGAAAQLVTAGPDDGVVLARAWGLEATPAGCELYSAVYATVPEVQQALAPGAAYLDVGSGVGGNLLTTALLFPGVAVTGVEIDAEVGDELARRVAAAGLADRVSLRVQDAASIADVDRFDVAFWAQEFFADDARAAVLEALVRAVRPGGWLLLQEFASGEPEASPVAALDRLFRRGWNAARSRTAEELTAEVAGAGFEPVEIRTSAAGRLVLMRRPVAAEAPDAGR